MLNKILEQINVQALAKVLGEDDELGRLCRGLGVKVALLSEEDASPDSPALFLTFSEESAVKPEVVDRAKASAADYVLKASSEVWKDVIEGKLEPVWAVSTGKLKVVKGNFLTLASLLPPFRRLLELVREASAKLG